MLNPLPEPGGGPAPPDFIFLLEIYIVTFICSITQQMRSKDRPDARQLVATGLFVGFAGIIACVLMSFYWTGPRMYLIVGPLIVAIGGADMIGTLIETFKVWIPTVFSSILDLGVIVMSRGRIRPGHPDAPAPPAASSGPREGA
jgi:hypothetical protein